MELAGSSELGHNLPEAKGNCAALQLRSRSRFLYQRKDYPTKEDPAAWPRFQSISAMRGATMNTSRRDFLKVGAGAVAAISGVSGMAERTAAPAGKAPDMIYRKFGS